MRPCHMRVALIPPSSSSPRMRELSRHHEHCAERTVRELCLRSAKALLGLFAAVLVPATVLPAQSACRVGIVDSSRLSLLGRRAYVEPRTSASSGSDALLLGAPNILWPRKSLTDWKTAITDSLFGAWILPTGEARAVPKPPGVWPIRHVRSLGDGPGAYWVLFDQMELHAASFSADQAWWARFSEGTWSQPVRVPLPPGARINLTTGSQLVRAAGVIAFAALVTLPDGNSSITVFEWTNDRWTVTAPSAGDAAYVALAATDAGLLLAVVRADISGRFDRNSLYLQRLTPSGWRHTEQVQAGAAEGASHWPAFIKMGDHLYLAWNSERPSAPSKPRQLRLREIGTTQTVVLDSATELPPSAVVVDGKPAFVVIHRGADKKLYLRLIVVTATNHHLAFESDNPFHGTTSATQLGKRDILINGLGAVRDSLGRDVATLLLRLRVDCRTSSRRRRSSRSSTRGRSDESSTRMDDQRSVPADSMH